MASLPVLGDARFPDGARDRRPLHGWRTREGHRDVRLGRADPDADARPTIRAQHVVRRLQRPGHRLGDGHTARASALGRQAEAERSPRRRRRGARRSYGAAPAALPPRNYLKGLASGNGGLSKQTFTVVGYGVFFEKPTEGPQKPTAVADRTRRVADAVGQNISSQLS